MGLNEAYQPVFVYLAIVVAFVVATMVLSHLVPRVRRTAVKLSPYESGVDPVGDARRPFDVRYYRIAIDFLVFDVEVLLLFPGAVAFGQRVFEKGAFRADMFAVFVGILVFMLLLAVGYVYSWRKGSFRWR